MGERDQNFERSRPDRRATALAGVALRRHGMRGARLTLLSDGFKQVFRVEHSSGGVFSLRMYAAPPENPEVPGTDPRFRTGAGLRSPETLRAQLSWLSGLSRETDLPVPEPLPAPDGSLLGHASFADLPRGVRALRRVSPAHRRLYRPDYPGRHYVLLRWTPGEPRKGALSPGDAARIGAFAARLHDHAGSYRPPEPSALPRWGWDWPFGDSAPVWELGERFYSAAEMEVFGEVSRRVLIDLDRLGYGSRSFGVVHRDLTLQNLLFQDGSVRAVDFDLCGLGHYPFDLAVVLRVMGLRRRHGGRLDQLKEALFEGYEGVRDLPDAHTESLVTFDAMQKTAAVNRVLELHAAGDPHLPQTRGEPFLREAPAWLETYYLGRDPVTSP